MLRRILEWIEIRILSHLRRVETIIGILVVFVIATVLFPIALSQITESSVLPSSQKSTTWSSGAFQLFIILIPILVLVAGMVHVFGSFTEVNYDEYGNRTVGGRWNGLYGYDGYEQEQIEKEITDMHNYFKSDT